LSLSQSIPMASFYYLWQWNVSCHDYQMELLSFPQFYQKSGVHFTFFMLILADIMVTFDWVWNVKPRSKWAPKLSAQIGYTSMLTLMCSANYCFWAIFGESFFKMAKI
jgi:hypothetical protein